MLELPTLRKNKVNLADYNMGQDIENRILMADFSAFDIEVLEEILFSPLKISLKKFLRGSKPKEEALQKLQKTSLFTIDDDFILVDKELRKYFEFQILRFDPDFKPDMEFLSALLRKVPIHHLPNWYSIPRSSNNIFESIVEKYLLSPQIYHRYLSELCFQDQKIHSIISDLFQAPEFKLVSSDVIEKYNLERREYEEIMLLLEFNFIGSASFEKKDDHWIEIVTPFYEWQEYLRFLKNTEAPAVPNIKSSTSDFAFIDEMAHTLEEALKKPLPLTKTPSTAIQKLLEVELAATDKKNLKPTESSKSWLKSSREDQALYLYRHPKNRLLNSSISPQIATERNVREAEKSIKRALHGNWVYFDDFIKGVTVTLSEHSVIMLQRTGKHWKYTLPVYTESEKEFIKAVIFEWLFEMGMVKIANHLGKDCFAVTPFGKFFFEE